MSCLHQQLRHKLCHKRCRYNVAAESHAYEGDDRGRPATTDTVHERCKWRHHADLIASHAIPRGSLFQRGPHFLKREASAILILTLWSLAPHQPSTRQSRERGYSLYLCSHQVHDHSRLRTVRLASAVRISRHLVLHTFAYVDHASKVLPYASRSAQKERHSSTLGCHSVSVLTGSLSNDASFDHRSRRPRNPHKISNSVVSKARLGYGSLSRHILRLL